jgi:hypothetical protein
MVYNTLSLSHAVSHEFNILVVAFLTSSETKQSERFNLALDEGNKMNDTTQLLIIIQSITKN